MKLDPTDVIAYEINVPSFFDSDDDGFGDLAGVRQKLQDLVALGVNMIILSSVFETTNVRSLYEVTDFCRINPQIGEMQDMSELLSEANALGISVLLFLPFSCTSLEHPWFEKRKNPKYGSYYITSAGKGKENHSKPDRTKNLLNESAWTENDSGIFYKNTYGAFSPDLDLSNPEVCAEIREIARFWKSMGVEGFLLDAPDFSIERTSLQSGKMLYTPTPALFSIGKDAFSLFNEIKQTVGQDFLLVLRNFHADEASALYLTHGTPSAVDMLIFSDPNDHTRSPYVKPFSAKKFAKQYAALQNSPIRSRTILSLEDSMHARFISSFNGFNDASQYFCAAKALATLFGTTSGGILLFQGEEIAMSHATFQSNVSFSEDKKEDADKTRVFMQFEPYQWDGLRHAGFSSAAFPFTPVCSNYVRINKGMQENDPESVLNYYKDLLSIRNRHFALRKGNYKDYTASRSPVLCFTRATEEEILLVILSLSSENVNYSLPEELLAQNGKYLFGNYGIVSLSLHNTLALRPFEARIYQLDAEIKRLQ